MIKYFEKKPDTELFTPLLSGTDLKPVSSSPPSSANKLGKNYKKNQPFTVGGNSEQNLLVDLKEYSEDEYNFINEDKYDINNISNSESSQKINFRDIKNDHIIEKDGNQINEFGKSNQIKMTNKTQKEIDFISRKGQKSSYYTKTQQLQPRAFLSLKEIFRIDTYSPYTPQRTKRFNALALCLIFLIFIFSIVVLIFFVAMPFLQKNDTNGNQIKTEIFGIVDNGGNILSGNAIEKHTIVDAVNSKENGKLSQIPNNLNVLNKFTEKKELNKENLYEDNSESMNVQNPIAKGESLKSIVKKKCKCAFGDGMLDINTKKSFLDCLEQCREKILKINF